MCLTRKSISQSLEATRSGDIAPSTFDRTTLYNPDLEEWMELKFITVMLCCIRTWFLCATHF
uniref:Uncharacterized protein n=1 Tax=Helianthus annuus TaxID=4232 RepID=A0A251RRV8_HELAN